ncbi:flagellar hook-length control protein FliK [Roseateles sp. PN1]|uniref:flagellar hook-length control protein FliK n=1 Tax=Roseateles sp. PN1 TaxID=3137372 RepID=UPI0031393659
MSSFVNNLSRSDSARVSNPGAKPSSQPEGASGNFSLMLSKFVPATPPAPTPPPVTTTPVMDSARRDQERLSTANRENSQAQERDSLERSAAQQQQESRSQALKRSNASADKAGRGVAQAGAKPDGATVSGKATAQAEATADGVDASGQLKNTKAKAAASEQSESATSQASSTAQAEPNASQIAAADPRTAKLLGGQNAADNTGTETTEDTTASTDPANGQAMAGLGGKRSAQAALGRQELSAEQAKSQAAATASSSAANAEPSFAGQMQAANQAASTGLTAATPAKAEAASADVLAALSQAGPAVASGTGADVAPLNQGGSAASASQISLPQPLYSAAFAPEMAARLSVLASQGVQEAHLHLNPAEMGPVAVQIVVDGQQAQVSFHADNAQTREVLERGLPDLAAALRENGLTLSGGGVFQQQMSQQGQANQGQSQEGTSASRGVRMGNRSLINVDNGNSLSAARPMPRSTQGVLDLYA